MKKQKAVLSVISIVTFALGAFAQVPVGGGGTSVTTPIPVATPIPITETYTAGPIVPVEVAIKGREAITAYLKGTIDHINVQFTGNSVVAPSWRNNPVMDRVNLRVRGYIHDGSFSELVDVLSGVGFAGEVVPTPNGYYDVRASIQMFDTNNAIALLGNGYLELYRDSSGALNVGNFEPQVSINSSIVIQEEGQVDAAKWVGQNGNSEELNTSYNGRSTFITVSSGKLENGFLIFSDGSGHIKGWDLKAGSRLSGRSIFAILGTTRSGDVEILNLTHDTIGASYQNFNLYGDQIVGRFPLRDVVVPQTKANQNIWISFSVPVWGSRLLGSIKPSRILVSPINMNGPSAMQIGEWYELPKLDDAFRFNVPFGEYNLRTEFEGLMDYEETYGKYGYDARG